LFILQFTGINNFKLLVKASFIKIVFVLLLYSL